MLIYIFGLRLPLISFSAIFPLLPAKSFVKLSLILFFCFSSLSWSLNLCIRILDFGCCTVKIFDLAICYASLSFRPYSFASFIKVIAVRDSDSWTSFHWCLYQSSFRPFAPAIASLSHIRIWWESAYMLIRIVWICTAFALITRISNGILFFRLRCICLRFINVLCISFFLLLFHSMAAAATAIYYGCDLTLERCFINHRHRAYRTTSFHSFPFIDKRKSVSICWLSCWLHWK